MGLTRRAAWMLAVAVVCVPFVSGCFKLEANVNVNVDGSSDVNMKIAVSESLAALSGEGEDPFAEMKKELKDTPWQVSPFQEEGWQGIVMQARSVSPSELFPEAAQDQADITLEVTRRLFSTDYIVKGTMELQPAPMSPGGEETEEASNDRIVFTQMMEEDDEGAGGLDPEMFMGLLGAMGQQPSVRFVISAPGEIVETTGVKNEDGAAVWTMDMGTMVQGADAPSEMQIYVRTRLLNQQNIGRLADKLAAERNLDEMAALIADYVRRGLLPNPPKEAPLEASMSAAAYDYAIGVVVLLEEALGAPAARRIIEGMQLNADGVTEKQLRQAWESLSGMDEDELVEVAGQAIVKHLRMLSE